MTPRPRTTPTPDEIVRATVAHIRLAADGDSVAAVTALADALLIVIRSASASPAGTVELIDAVVGPLLHARTLAYGRISQPAVLP